MNRIITKPVRMTRKAIYRFRNRWFDDFIFIHINKTGGSSVEKALKLPIEHKTVKEKIKQVGHKTWNEKTSFTIIRNPWDKVVSHYHFRVQTNKTNLGKQNIPFADWVKRSYGEKDPKYYDKPKMFSPQIEWLIDESGKIAVDHLIRFENLSEELTEFLATLGRNVIIPHVKSSSRGTYQDYYTTETTEVIERWFNQDIDQFGYKFE